ncbi:hypothetical protein [Anaeromyxobacter terrae]|uniref:hypothetical protein n=1 Tax=Anaeromyxobacter terrae TaxID=2925406 RepID=UPI001F598306|nr:hypothetical protein [Anaeromyxobacter sp. SG22]
MSSFLLFMPDVSLAVPLEPVPMSLVVLLEPVPMVEPLCGDVEPDPVVEPV